MCIHDSMSTCLRAPMEASRELALKPSSFVQLLAMTLKLCNILLILFQSHSSPIRHCISTNKPFSTSLRAVQPC